MTAPGCDPIAVRGCLVSVARRRQPHASGAVPGVFRPLFVLITKAR